jgi:riboflavin synthase alpha subunit
MFTGLIEETASVLWIRATDRGTQLQLSAPRIAGDVHTGDSISVNRASHNAAQPDPSQDNREHNRESG